MATYKVIQDIEAEDKLIGWMTPRQTIYAAIVIVSGFIWFMLASNGAWWLGIIFLPHIILLTVLCAPFVHDQPSEVWLLAKIRFFLLPKRRIWDQSGLKELVTITVPKKVERQLTDGLSQTEVKSRLQALANTIDSRGWAVKNVDLNMLAPPAFVANDSDRLIDTGSFPREVPMYEVTAQDDILDEQNNPVAQHLERMISEQTRAHREQLVERMHQPQPTAPQQPADYWFMNATTQQQTPATTDYPALDPRQIMPPTDLQTNTPNPVEADVPDVQQEALLAKIQSKKSHVNDSNKNLHTIKTAEERQAEEAVKQAQAEQAAQATAQQYAENNDWDVATIARQANKKPQKPDDGEVVVSLR